MALKQLKDLKVEQYPRIHFGELCQWAKGFYIMDADHQGDAVLLFVEPIRPDGSNAVADRREVWVKKTPGTIELASAVMDEQTIFGPLVLELVEHGWQFRDLYE